MYFKTPDSTKRLRLRYGAAAPSPATGVAHLFAATHLTTNVPTREEQAAKLRADRFIERVKQGLVQKEQDLANKKAEKAKLEDVYDKKKEEHETLVEELQTKGIMIKSVEAHLETLKSDFEEQRDVFSAHSKEMKEAENKVIAVGSDILVLQKEIAKDMDELREIENAAAETAMKVGPAAADSFARTANWESGSREDLGKVACTFLQAKTAEREMKNHRDFVNVKVALTKESLAQRELMKEDMVLLWAIMAEGNFAKNAVCPDDWKSSARGNINGLTAVQSKTKKLVAYALVDSLVDD